VFDNGGTDANDESWGGSGLTCAIWRMNDAGNVLYVENRALSSAGSLMLVGPGDFATDSSGTLTSVSILGVSQISIGYTSNGIALTTPISWNASGTNFVFSDGNGSRSFEDVAGGVQMTTARWSNPVNFTGPCDTTTTFGMPTTATTTAIASPTVADIIAPSTGGTPNLTATVPAGANYTVTGPVSWSPTDNPFVDGQVYTAEVTLTANNGYTFTGFTGNASINGVPVNGVTATVVSNTGTTLTLSLTFPAATGLAAGGGAASVPTLGEWGAALLTLLAAGLGAPRLRRRA
jgi:hypothetical protein